MGCCEEKGTKYSTMDFYVELFNLEPYEDNRFFFTIKKLGSEKFDKVIEKTLKEHLANSKLMQNKNLDKRFQFNINNALFYCYLNDNPIVKNYLQVKDLEVFNFDTLYKISILLTKNYDQLSLPKIYLINKTKFVSDLNNFELDFSNITIDTTKIFDPNISNDDLVLTKPHLTEDLSEIHEEENENNSKEEIDERNEKDERNGKEERESDSNNESDNDSVYEDEGEEENNEIEINNQHENSKNYIHIKGEITPEIVRSIFQKLSPYIDDGDDEDDEGKDKNGAQNNKEIMRNFRKSKSSIASGLDGLKRKSDVSIIDENIFVKKGKEIPLKLESIKESEHEQKEQITKEKEKEPKNKIIDSVFIEGLKNIDLEVFSELIEILSIYPYLKRLSFCDFHFDKEFEGWENIIHLINENNKIRWLDLHKSNINNCVLEQICKVIENKRIRYLDLSENFINQDGSQTIGEFLRKNKTLQRLILNNNDLEDFKKIGVGYICDPLVLHPNIQHLDFSSMTITGCGESIANLIKATKSIRSIILRDCLLNLKDFQHICRALSLENISNTIINVDMSHNDMASDKSLEEIGNMIKVNKTLHTLNMEKMNLTMSNYNLIFNGLNENDTISDFSFCYNPNVKPRIILEYFLHRKKLSSLVYIPYKEGINDKGPKVQFTLDERKLIEKFKKKRKKVKLIYR